MSIVAEDTTRAERILSSVDEGDIDELSFIDKKIDARLAISSSYLHRLQVRHFLLFQVGPIVLTLAALTLAFFVPVTRLDLSLFATMWLLTGLGISAGYHRLLCHRSYTAAEPLRIALTILGSMAAQGAALSWVAMHRRHHQIPDQLGDVHSPNLHGSDLRGRIRGFFHSHFTWMLEHDYPNVAHYVPDLLDDPVLVRVSRLYTWWIVLGFAVPAVIGSVVTESVMGAITGFLWGGGVRMLVVGQSISALNSVLHMFGTKRFKSRGEPDNSRNSALMGALVWGEGWHNNHHAFPYSASFALAWYKLDISYWFIKAMQVAGLVTNVKVPSRDRILKRAAQG